ncbi:hypothetical protein E1211_24170, partial [Micromonospora sp. 15K316]|uniref:hypothetical protein n=1 Tax=Micromonospora sp. 15K316 TaxID=2530376 RepID=UPI001049DCAB
MIPDRLNRQTAERLLDDPVGVAQTGGHPVALLLLAARAAPQPREYDGENAALVAFRRASAQTVGERPDVDPSPVRAGSGQNLGRLAVRTGLAVLVLAATGGVAMAATGSLPGTRPAPPTTAPAPSAPIASAVPPVSTTRPTPSTATSTTEAPASENVLPDLCRSYRADPGHGLRGPDLAALVAAAGARSGVAAYCDRVLAGDARRATPTPGRGRASSPPAARPVT